MRHDICLSIGQLSFDEIVKNLDCVALAEIRIDLLDLTRDQLKTIFNLHQNLIATYRPMDDDFEAMYNSLSDALDWGCAMIDIDIDVPDIWHNKLVTKAKEMEKVVVLSYHNFKETPTTDALNSVVLKMKNSGADIAKIACLANSKEDCSRILGLYVNHKNLVALCMGEFGKITRLAAPLLGAPFTYASVGKEVTAPGQLDYEQTQRLLSVFD